jgi:hypothetical protein
MRAHTLRFLAATLLVFCGINIDVPVRAQGIGGIRGRLTDAFTGAPVADTRLQLQTRYGVVQTDVRSGPDGRFEILGLAPGDYFLAASEFGNPIMGPPPYALRWYGGVNVPENATPIVVSAGAIAENRDIALFPNTGAIDVPLRFDEPFGGPVNLSAFSCAVGRYVQVSGPGTAAFTHTINGLAAGTYRLTATDASGGMFPALYMPANQVTVTIAQTETAVAPEMRLRKGARVSVRLDPALSEAPTPHIKAYTRNGGVAGSAFNNLTLGPLPTGDYAFQVVGNEGYASSFSGDSATLAGAAFTSITSPVALVITIPTRSGVKIAGRVLAGDTGETMATNVMAYDANGVIVAEDYASQGTYTLTVAPGVPYRIAFFNGYSPAPRYVTGFIGPSMSITTAATITPVAAVTPLTITILVGLRINARIQDRAGVPPREGVTVAAIDQNGVALADYTVSPFAQFGRWISQPLLPGVYRLRFDSFRYDDATCTMVPLQTWFSGGASSLADAQLITVTASGDVTHTEIIPSGVAPTATPPTATPIATQSPTATPRPGNRTVLLPLLSR